MSVSAGRGPVEKIVGGRVIKDSIIMCAHKVAQLGLHSNLNSDTSSNIQCLILHISCSLAYFWCIYIYMFPIGSFIAKVLIK